MTAGAAKSLGAKMDFCQEEQKQPAIMGFSLAESMVTFTSFWRNPAQGLVGVYGSFVNSVEETDH